MPHVLVEITRVPKGRKGIPYLDENQERCLAVVGDKFELRNGSAQALARNGYGKIVGMGPRQQRVMKARQEREQAQITDEITALEAKLEQKKRKRAKKKDADKATDSK